MDAGAHRQVELLLKSGFAYLLEAMFDPLIPVGKHFEPFQFSLPGNFHSKVLFAAQEQRKEPLFYLLMTNMFTKQCAEGLRVRASPAVTRVSCH